MPRSTWYYQPRPDRAENLRLLRQLDQLYLQCPFYGSRKMAVELEAARLLVYRAGWMADAKQKIRNEAFIAKLYATEMAQRVTDRCIQIFGGLGYTRELPIQSFFRQVRVWRIGHGTAEIHRWMIARNMLGQSSRD